MEVKSYTIGYRCWMNDELSHNLRSMVYTTQWPRREKLSASCESHKRDFDAHPAPKYDCQCGIYSCNQIGDLDFHTDAIYGRVAIWGRVVVTERGFRSEYAYPQVLYWYEEGAIAGKNDRDAVRKMADKYGAESMPAPAALAHLQRLLGEGPSTSFTTVKEQLLTLPLPEAENDCA